jgi:hypothetical protein
MKYISSNKLNLAIILQIIGITLLISGTPMRTILGIATFIYGAFLYRRTLHIIRDRQREVQRDGDDYSCNQ